MPFNNILYLDSTDENFDFLKGPWGCIIDGETDPDNPISYIAMNGDHVVMSFLVNEAFSSTGEIIIIHRFVDETELLENPTAIVHNKSCGYIIRDDISGKMAPSKLIIATNTDGNSSLYGFSPEVDINAAIFQINVPNSNFTGMEIDNESKLLYVCDYANNIVRTFDKTFTEITSGYPFLDVNLDEGYSCFGIHKIGCKLYVCYSSETRTPLSGFVNVFDLHGLFIERYISDIGLDGAFTMSCAPECWGRHQKLFHVANNGSGLISTYNSCSGKFNSYLRNMEQEKLVIEGLRTIVPYGKRLYCVSSPNGGISGQVSSIRYV